jgi:signal transduction histidine kinase
MIGIEDKLYKDFIAVNRIDLVPMMLEVICRTMGMGFAAIARVTENRWLACSVRDEVKFGLEAGGELQIETTICNEIRDHRQAVVIDHAAKDQQYANHHTPKFYRLQSYISFPILLKDGSFFGTLCAIDSKPAESRELRYFKDENRQFRHISSHTLQEPLRKIRLFSDYLITNTELESLASAKDVAIRINTFALDISGMIRELSEYSQLADNDAKRESVDLNKTFSFVCSQMNHLLVEKKAVLKNEVLPTVDAVPIQMAQLFSHLIGNAVKFAKTDEPPLISVYTKKADPEDLKSPLLPNNGRDYLEIVIEDNGIGIEPIAMGKIYDLFVRATPKRVGDGFGSGLAYCRRIIHNHGGLIKARSTVGEGAAFSIILPMAGAY